MEAESKALSQAVRRSAREGDGAGGSALDGVRRRCGYRARYDRCPSGRASRDWVMQEWRVILKDRDTGYAANCAQWWSATGPIQAYMKRYKDYLVQERIPYEKKLIDEPKLDQFKMLSVPTEGWRHDDGNPGRHGLHENGVDRVRAPERLAAVPRGNLLQVNKGDVTLKGDRPLGKPAKMKGTVPFRKP